MPGIAIESRLREVAAFAMAIMAVLLYVPPANAQQPFSANFRQMGAIPPVPQALSQVPPAPAPAPAPTPSPDSDVVKALADKVLEKKIEDERAKPGVKEQGISKERMQELRASSLREVMEAFARLQEAPQPSPAPSPGFPVRITDIQGSARAAVVVDTTRLDPGAINSGLFLPGAIPAKGEGFFGLGERTTLQGQGSSAGFSWLANLGDEAVTGQAKAELTVSSASGDPTLIAPQVWLAWRNLTFGVTDSAFTDTACIPDTIDIGGPNARPWVRNGVPQIRYTISPDNYQTCPTGLYLTGSVEAPAADIYTPVTPAGTPVYSPFSQCPGFVAALTYKNAEMVPNPCTKQPVYNENFHVQWGTVVGDVGVDRSDNSVREDACCWGTQLSGQYTILRNPCEGLRDFLYFSVTYGEGIGHLFNDLHLVNAVNDATYESTTNTLTPTPLFGFFGGITHEWTGDLRSTVVYSRLELDNRQVTGGGLAGGVIAALPYENGQYMSINLVYHYEPCVKDPTASSQPGAQPKMVQHHVMAGIEYLYGQKENILGGYGSDQRVMFMVGAAN